MRLIIAAAMAAAAFSAFAQTPSLPSAAPGAPDPFAWLEDIHGARAMAWVEAQNHKTAQRLESDPRYDTFRRQALTIFTARDRIPKPEFLGQAVGNF